MGQISVGAVGAAIIAGLISILGLVIGKEQKISEFRQAWINDLRQCLSDYLVHINAICDAVRLNNSGRSIDEHALIDLYKSLNKANHGIRFRINDSEETASKLLQSMTRFEELAKSKDNLTPEKIKEIENDYIRDAKALLKHEWNRVKRGEKIYVVVKYGVIILTVALLWLAGLIFMLETEDEDSQRNFRVFPAQYISTSAIHVEAAQHNCEHL